MFMLPQITRISTDLYNPPYVRPEPQKSYDQLAARHTKSARAVRAIDGRSESAGEGEIAGSRRNRLRVPPARLHP